MKRFALIAVLLLFSMPLVAQEPATTPILVVDIKRVLDDSTAAVNVQRKIETFRSSFQTEIAGKEKAVREAEQDLLQQRGKIDNAAFAEKENQLRQRFKDVEKYVQDRRAVLEQATTNSMGHVRSVLQKIVMEIAKKRGASAVLAKQDALWTDPALDVTEEVLQRLNKDLPDMDVVIDKPEKADKPAAKTQKR